MGNERKKKSLNRYHEVKSESWGEPEPSEAKLTGRRGSGREVEVGGRESKSKRGKRERERVKRKRLQT